MPRTSIRHLAAVFVVAAGVVVLHPLSLAAQPETSATASPPQTRWGHPDLRGVWDFSSNTPLERPPELR